MYLPPRIRLIVGVASVTAFALILAACAAGPEVAEALNPYAAEGDSASIGTELQNLAGKTAGPAGYVAAGYFLKVLYAFVKSTVKSTASAAKVAVAEAAKAVGIKDGSGGPTP